MCLCITKERFVFIMKAESRNAPGCLPIDAFSFLSPPPPFCYNLRNRIKFCKSFVFFWMSAEIKCFPCTLFFRIRSVFFFNNKRSSSCCSVAAAVVHFDLDDPTPSLAASTLVMISFARSVMELIEALPYHLQKKGGEALLYSICFTALAKSSVWQVSPALHVVFFSPQISIDSPFFSTSREDIFFLFWLQRESFVCLNLWRIWNPVVS